MSRRKKPQFRLNNGWHGHRWEVREHKPWVNHQVTSDTLRGWTPDTLYGSNYVWAGDRQMASKPPKTWFCEKCGAIAIRISACKTHCNDNIMEQVIDS